MVTPTNDGLGLCPINSKKKTGKLKTNDFITQKWTCENVKTTFSKSKSQPDIRKQHNYKGKRIVYVNLYLLNGYQIT